MAYLDFIDPGNAAGSVPVSGSPFDLVGAKKIEFTCSICGEIFESEGQFLQHRFENHPLKRPTLLISGMEILSPRHLVISGLSTDDITLGNTSHIELNNKIIAVDDLRKILSKKKQGLCSIRLKNEKVESNYQIDFDIPEQSDLEKVEYYFFEIVGQGLLDLNRIDLFIQMSKDYKTAIRYLDGLSNYLYGILAKEQRGGTMLPQEDFLIKFNQASEILKYFDRPLASTIVAVINFNQNIFKISKGLEAAPKVELAMRKFFQLINGSNSNHDFHNSSDMNNSKKIPLDNATDRIFDFTIMSNNDLLQQIKELEHLSKHPLWVINDRSKIIVLMVELLIQQGDISKASNMAISFLNDPIFGKWYQRVIAYKD